MAVPWTQQVEELVTSTLLLARTRSGRIAALNVSVPGEISEQQVSTLLRARLAACGHPGLEIVTHVTSGPMRITSAEFER